MNERSSIKRTRRYQAPHASIHFLVWLRLSSRSVFSPFNSSILIFFFPRRHLLHCRPDLDRDGGSSADWSRVRAWSRDQELTDGRAQCALRLHVCVCAQRVRCRAQFSCKTVPCASRGRARQVEERKLIGVRDRLFFFWTLFNFAPHIWTQTSTLTLLLPLEARARFFAFFKVLDLCILLEGILSIR